MTGEYMSRGRTASVIEFVGITTLAIALLVYASIAAYTKDPLWFWPVFDAQPSAIVIRCYGQELLVATASTEGSAITKLVNEQLSGPKRWDELNLSDQTHSDYLTNPGVMVLELYYAVPVRVHSHSPFFSNINSLIIPLDGRFADEDSVFGLINDKPTGGSFHVESTREITDYVTQRSLCIKP